MSTSLPTPQPTVTPETDPFWRATAEGRLLLRRCDACATPIWYPRDMCPICGSFDTSWTEASGRGTVYAHTVVHRTRAEGYRDAVPYVLAYVELDEGPRVLTNVVGCDPADVRIGMPVVVTFEETAGGSALYRFRPAPPGPS